VVGVELKCENRETTAKTAKTDCRARQPTTREALTTDNAAKPQTTRRRRSI